jgi:hypothetical protein
MDSRRRRLRGGRRRGVQPASWVYADILWALSLLAIVYAGLVAFLAQGMPRVAAAGFLLASLCFVVYVTVASLNADNATAITRILTAAGYEQFQPGPYYYVPTPVAQPSPTIAATPIPSTATGTLGHFSSATGRSDFRDAHGRLRPVRPSGQCGRDDRIRAAGDSCRFGGAADDSKPTLTQLDHLHVCCRVATLAAGWPDKMARALRAPRSFTTEPRGARQWNF